MKRIITVFIVMIISMQSVFAGSGGDRVLDMVYGFFGLIFIGIILVLISFVIPFLACLPGDIKKEIEARQYKKRTKAEQNERNLCIILLIIILGLLAPFM